MSAEMEYPVEVSLRTGGNSVAKMAQHTIEVKDARNGSLIFVVEIDPLSLVNILTRSTSGPAVLTWARTEGIGKHRHVESLSIPATFGQKVPTGGWEQYEQDGWSCRRDDYGNHHRFTKNTYSVTRTRLHDTPQEGRVDREYDPRTQVLAQALDIAKYHRAADRDGFYVQDFISEAP